MNPEKESVVNSFWMPSIVFDKNMHIITEDIVEAFQNENVDARVFFHPLSSLDMFESKHQNVNAYDIPKRAINVPGYHDLDVDDQDRIIGVIEELVDGKNH
jgi:perosamine synthetase